MFSRRNILGLLLTAVCGFSGCTCNRTTESGAQDSRSAEPSVEATAPRLLSLYIWGNYIDPAVLQDFETRTGIRVEPSFYDSNETLLAKIQAGATGFDVAVPSDYMVSVMVNQGYVEELDKRLLPNEANLDPRFLRRPFDPENRFSLPYSWSIGGIAYNTKQYPDAVTSWRDLFANPKVAGKISVLDDYREAIGAALKLHGASVNSVVPEELALARASLLELKPHIKAFSSAAMDLLANGDVVMAMMYSQEALQARRQHGEHLVFVIPSEGAVLAIDNLVVLKGAPHRREAYAFINYLCEMAVNSLNVSHMYLGPVVKNLDQLVPADLKGLPTLFPSEEVLQRTELLQDVGAATQSYERIWSELKASS